MATKHRNNTLIAQRGGMVVPSLQASTAARRFEKFVTSLDKSIENAKPDIQLMACVLTLESISRPNDLLSFLQCCEEPILAGPKVLVSWMDDKSVVHRRALSSRTQIALSRLDDSKTNWDLKISELKQFLIQKYPDAKRFRSNDLIDIVCGDSVAWGYHVLPKFCTGYLTGNLRGKLLPPSRLAEFLLPQKTSDNKSDANLWEEIELFDKASNVSAERTFDNSEPTYASGNLAALQSIFSDPASGNSIRASQFRQRTQLIERINSVALLISKSGSAIDAFLLGWAIFLINQGSIRLSNPTVSTIGGYFRIAPAICKAFSALRLQPIELTQEQWEDFFTAQKHQALGPSLAALQSFHQFVIAQLGIDPVAHMGTANNDDSNIRASVVTESEFFRCVQMADSISLDERIRASVKAILTFGYSVPIRISELKGLHICDVKIYPGLAEIHYAPRRTETSGKSNAAHRAMKVTDPLLIKHLSTWLERRKKDLALDDDPLFGDPHSSELYQFGRCVHLTNKILKMVCKDQEASFHDFRHAWVTRNVIDLTDPEGHSPKQTIEELQVQIGHTPQSNTIFESYFHCHDLLIRQAVDDYMRKFEITGPAAAFWLGRKSDALRAGKSRSAQPERYYREQIQIGASEIWSPRLKQVPQHTVIRDLTNNPGLLAVRKFLADLYAGLDADAVSSRCGLDADSLMELTCISLRSVAILRNRYSTHEIVKSNDPKEIHLLLRSLRAELLQLNFDFGLRVEPVLQTAYENLLTEKHENTDFKDAIEGWTGILKGKYWSLEKASIALPPIKFLIAKGMDATCLEIRYACNDPTDTYSASCALDSPKVKAAILQVKTIAPFMRPPLPVRHKPGRPSVYLVLRRNSEHPTPGGLTDSARCRYGRINGLMFSLLVLQTLNHLLMEIDR